MLENFLPDYDSSLDEEEYVSGLAINIENPLEVDKFIADLKIPKEMQVITWKDVNKSLLLALTLEKVTMSLHFAFNCSCCFILN